MTMRRSGLRQDETYPGPFDLATRIDELLVQQVGYTKELLQAVRALAARPSGVPGIGEQLQDFANPVTFETIDLSSAHSNYDLTLAAGVEYVQAWCDGSLDGITIKPGRQDANAVDLRQFRAFPVRNCDRLYITNDVRPGRNTLVLALSRAAVLQPTYGGELVDRAELAARLGGLSTFDRRGDVVWFDDFEGVQLKWSKIFLDTTGTLGLIARTTANPKSGKACCKLVTGATLNDWSFIEKYLALPAHIRFGVEVSFLLDTGTEQLFDIRMRVANGTNIYYSAVIANCSTNKITYLNSAGAQVAVADWYPPKDTVNAKTGYITAKFVIDYGLGKYVRAMVGNVAIDLSSYILQAVANTDYYLYISCGLKTLEGASHSCVVDDIIITKNEP